MAKSKSQGGDYMGYCSPAVVNLALGLITIVLGLNANVPATGLFFHFLLIGIWTFLLNNICESGYTWLSWVLVIVPFVVSIVFFGYAMTSLPAQSVPTSNPNFLDTPLVNSNLNANNKQPTPVFKMGS